MAQGILLANSSALGAYTGSSKFWQGGRAALIIDAAQFGASVLFQIQNSNQNWIAINSSTIAQNSVLSYDVPAGQVRVISTGSSAGLTANLVEIPYI